MRPTFFFLLPLLAATALGQRYPVATGPNVDVVCWFPNEAHGDDLAASALAVAEEARAATLQALGLSDRGAEEDAPRLVVNVYENRRGRDGFAEAVDGLEPGVSEGLVAWHHPASRGVFVKLQPVANDFLLEELGFPPLSLHHVARHTALLEMTLSGADPMHPAGPRWLREGLATWIADRVLVARGRFVEGAADPTVSTRVRVARRLLREGRRPGLGEWLAEESSELDAYGLDEDEVHALDATLVRFVAERVDGDTLASFAGPACRGELPVAVAPDALFAALGLGGADEVEHEWATWLDGLPAPWDDEYPCLSKWGDEGGWIQAATNPRFALTWNEPPPWKEYVIRAEVEMFRRLGDGTCQLNFALGRLPSGEYISLGFNSRGGVIVFNFDPDHPDHSEEGAFVVMTPIPLGTGLAPRKRYRITLHVTEGLITPFVRDLDDEERPPQRLRPMSIEGRDMSGAWGIGSQRGGATIWYSVGVEPYVEGGSEPDEGDGDEDGDGGDGGDGG